MRGSAGRPCGRDPRPPGNRRARTTPTNSAASCTYARRVCSLSDVRDASNPPASCELRSDGMKLDATTPEVLPRPPDSQVTVTPSAYRRRDAVGGHGHDHPSPRGSRRRSAMLAAVRSAVLEGVDGRVVTVEVHVSPGCPATRSSGCPTPPGASRGERVRAAMLSSRLEYPQQRVTVNLAPASVRKTGSGLELAVALALLCAVGRTAGRRARRRGGARRARPRRPCAAGRRRARPRRRARARGRGARDRADRERGRGRRSSPVRRCASARSLARAASRA